MLLYWKFLLLHFREAHATKYAYEAFTLLAQTKALLTPRDKLFHLHCLKTSLIVCDGASTNLAVIKATHGHIGALLHLKR